MERGYLAEAALFARTVKKLHGKNKKRIGITLGGGISCK
jgi:hypothetical protein